MHKLTDLKSKEGFTLAEVLITLAIIGVVAAISIPSVISNSQQQEFKTGLRKAVSVLNSAITMNMALDGETPYDNANLYGFLMKHMAVIKTMSQLPWKSSFYAWNGTKYSSQYNGAFYTTDGMRFEFDDAKSAGQVSSNLLKLHESDSNACFSAIYDNSNKGNAWSGHDLISCGGCGSYGLKHNPNNTTKVPCAILVDVNGDKKPTPQKAASTLSECLADSQCNQLQKYWIPTLETNKVSDIFVILITEDRAIPFGVVAQKAMYQAQK